jgi:FMNH2-dependent dimethyl sulfone monooxygenase
MIILFSLGVFLKAKLGVYAPVYGGWLRGTQKEDEYPNYSYAEKSVLKAEEIGIKSIWVPDHMLNPMKGEKNGSLEAWTLLTALAAKTKSVELFHTTLCQGFRYPAVLAKMCATLDDISEGRFRFSFGAGWFEREFRSYGVPWHDHDTRIDRSREQIEILKSMWTKPVTCYKGRFYEIDEGVLEPKPVQKPHPPIWWGGQSPKSRELVADLADGWLMGASTLKEAGEKIGDMRRRLDERGRDEILYAIPGRIYMGDSDDSAEDYLKGFIGDNRVLYESIIQRGFVGSPETIVERIHRLEDLGFNYIIFQISPAMESLEKIEKQLLPIL